MVFLFFVIIVFVHIVTNSLYRSSSSSFLFFFFAPSSYGDMPAHNLLWRECDKTSDNVAARLAAIPLVQVLCWMYLLHL